MCHAQIFGSYGLGLGHSQVSQVKICFGHYFTVTEGNFIKHLLKLYNDENISCIALKIPCSGLRLHSKDQMQTDVFVMT